jgi:hypothetical protein
MGEHHTPCPSKATSNAGRSQWLTKDTFSGSGFRSRLHVVVAESYEIHGDHLTFLDSKSKLLIVFLLDVIEDWNQT